MTPPSGTVVMKFGGSSVADPAGIARVAHRLSDAKERGARVVGVLSAMGDTTDDLLMLARRVSLQPPPRELDMLLSVGEQISCALVAMAIRELGHESVSLTGPQAGILTDTTHGKAKIVDIRALRIRGALDRGEVVLVTGFQGLGGDEITTLGRGGSDATAVALAAVLGAASCEIFTDVEGVYSADPRLVADARKLDFLSYDEMLELAAAGAAVLQLRAVELAQTHDVTVHVRSSFSEADGTRVGVEEDRSFERPLISAVGHAGAEALYRVVGADQADLFGALAGASVNVDTIIRVDNEFVFSSALDECDDVAHVLAGLGVRWSSRVDLGRVSIVGGGMKSHPGIAAAIFAVVSDLGLEARFVSTSPIKISFYVPCAALDRTVRALHARLRPGFPSSYEPDDCALRTA
jgi:aspartate kinase